MKRLMILGLLAYSLGCHAVSMYEIGRQIIWHMSYCRYDEALELINKFENIDMEPVDEGLIYMYKYETLYLAGKYEESLDCIVAYEQLVNNEAYPEFFDLFVYKYWDCMIIGKKTMADSLYDKLDKLNTHEPPLNSSFTTTTQKIEIYLHRGAFACAEGEIEYLEAINLPQFLTNLFRMSLLVYAGKYAEADSLSERMENIEDSDIVTDIMAAFYTYLKSVCALHLGNPVNESELAEAYEAFPSFRNRFFLGLSFHSLPPNELDMWESLLHEHGLF